MLAEKAPDVLGRRAVALLVARDADARQMYATYLKQASFDIDEAEDGREALAKALTLHPDAIVTEARLPGISGVDLCKLLRHDLTTRSIALVLVTGDTLDSEIKRAEAAAADVVLVKPCRPETLASELHRLLIASRDLRVDSGQLRDRIRRAVDRSHDEIERSRANVKRVMLNRAHVRGDTTDPPAAPPALMCPACDQPLRYERSHIGGVSVRHAEQWDYFECPSGCGMFQYRQRTRKLRKV